MMNVIPIKIGYSFGFNPSVCVANAETNEIYFAMSQERANNEKNTREMPFDAMRKFFENEYVKNSKFSLEDISYSHWRILYMDEIVKYLPEKYKSFLSLEDMFVSGSEGLKLITERILTSCYTNICISPKYYDTEALRVTHHDAHIASAYGFYPIKKHMINICADGFGDGTSMLLTYSTKTVENAVEKVLQLDFPLEQSIGLIYQFVTGALGYKEHQHEGKLTGLAAYSQDFLLKDFEHTFLKQHSETKFDMKKLKTLSFSEQKEADDNIIFDFDKFLRLKKTTRDLVAELLEEGKNQADIAAGLQSFTEKVTLARIEEFFSLFYSELADYIDKDDDVSVYLSGGLFANVKLNQKIRNLVKKFDIKTVYVTPPMGDEGTAIGAILHDAKNINVKTNLKNALLGTTMNINEFEMKFKPHFAGYIDENLTHKANTIAALLAQKKIVCLCQGRMEFGPRALCNRSIIYDCSDYETNNWLNKKLSRTEFMPFAPVCLDVDAADLFFDIENSMDSARFMTMTFDCTEEMKEENPAAVHVDGTARPQIIFKDEAPLMYEILTEYKRLTGKKALINTSFNLHNNPIIEDPIVAYDSWDKSDTDALLLENLLYIKENKNE